MRDLHWIRGALQSAIAIEHATMPLYASAMYSLEVQNYPAYNTLRSVLMEEMLHMAAACNTLAALGGRPQIRQLDPTAIRKGLAGLVAPGLTARFAQLSRKQLETFMRIESPLELLPADQRKKRYPTIGSLYTEIKQAVLDNAEAVSVAIRGTRVANQVGGNIGYAAIDKNASLEAVLKSLDLIINQGEGYGDTTLSSGPCSQDEMSHYARFAELRYGRSWSGSRNGADTITAEGQRRYFQGEKIEWPSVINMLAVPNDGYAAILRMDPNKIEVLSQLRAFDAAYTRMLAALDDAWNGPEETSWPSLGKAVFEMNELRVTSCFNILRHRVPAAAVAKLPALYPNEYDELRRLSDLDKPLYYGPRFMNTDLPASR
jgi:hypothetical protein